MGEYTGVERSGRNFPWGSIPRTGRTLHVKMYRKTYMRKQCTNTEKQIPDHFEVQRETWSRWKSSPCSGTKLKCRLITKQKERKNHSKTTYHPTRKETENKICHNSKNDNRKIYFSFVSAHCASIM